MSSGSTGSSGGDSTVVNALLGAVAAVVLFFLPFQTVIGGAVAGYLQGSDTEEGLRVGALVGVFLMVPVVVLVILFGVGLLAVVPFLDLSAIGLGAVGFLFVAMFLVFGALYTVGLAALGGRPGSVRQPGALTRS